jgi:hypothetical protein
MSNVADCDSCSCSCRECRDLPHSPRQAAEVPRFDVDSVRSVLDEAHGLVWEDEDASDLSTRLELTFRTYNPDNGFHDVTHCRLRQGQWMRYRCDLTRMEVAVRKGSPIPVIAIHETLGRGKKSLARCFKIHPDLLSSREHLLEALALRLEDLVADGLYRARQALSCFQFMSGRRSLPGVETGSVSYPQGYGYEVLSERPISEEG